MHEEVIFAGFGGQGVLFAGQLLSYAAMADGKHVTWIPSYGPEMRGGTANCTVVVSDQPIGSPMAPHPSVVVAFNNPSVVKYLHDIKPGGLLVVNSSLVTADFDRDDISIVQVSATDKAHQLGEVRLANMILSGAMLGVRPLVSVETLIDTIRQKLPARKKHLLAVNIEAIQLGARLAREQLELA